MPNFIELAKAIGLNNNLDTQSNLSKLKGKKQEVTAAIDSEIAKEELKLSQQKIVQDQIKLEEKRAKLKADLIKSMVDEQQVKGPVAVGGNLLEQYAPQVEQDAQDLPMIDMNSKV